MPSPLFPPETPPRGPAGCCVSKHHALQHGAQSARVEPCVAEGDVDAVAGLFALILRRTRSHCCALCQVCLASPCPAKLLEFPPLSSQPPSARSSSQSPNQFPTSFTSFHHQATPIAPGPKKKRRGAHVEIKISCALGGSALGSIHLCPFPELQLRTIIPPTPLSTTDRQTDRQRQARKLFASLLLFWKVRSGFRRNCPVHPVPILSSPKACRFSLAWCLGRLCSLSSPLQSTPVHPPRDRTRVRKDS